MTAVTTAIPLMVTLTEATMAPPAPVFEMFNEIVLCVEIASEPAKLTKTWPKPLTIKWFWTVMDRKEEDMVAETEVELDAESWKIFYFILIN
jgi:hypothetical protein